MKNFYFVNKDYGNESLNNLARRVAEYNMAELVINEYNVSVVDVAPEGSENQEIGKLSLRPNVPYTVNDLYIINDIFNYNLFFEKNTSGRLEIPDDLKGTFDCLVSLAAGDSIINNPVDIDLKGEHHIIDISPTAIHKTMGIYKENNSKFTQLDIFNDEAVDRFLEQCTGTRGFFVISNCYMYIVNALIYDVNLRLEMQNKFLTKLANDKIEWYVNVVSADGIFYPCVKAQDLTNKKLDSRYEVFPWIKK